MNVVIKERTAECPDYVYRRGRFAVTHTRTIVSYNNNMNNKCYLQIIITRNNRANNILSIYTSVKVEK